MKYTRGEAKEFTAEHLKGIWAANLTPFAEDLSVDEAGFRANLRHWIDDLGIAGLFVCGKQAEFFSMSLDERKRQFEIVMEEVGGRAARYYLFTTGAYRYVVLDRSGDAREPRTGCLFVYRSLARIRAEPIRRVPSDTAAGSEAGSCDIDIGAKIERWLAQPE